MDERFSINIPLAKNDLTKLEHIENMLKGYKDSIYAVSNTLDSMGPGTHELRHSIEKDAESVRNVAKTTHKMKESLEDIIRLYELSEAKVKGDCVQGIAVVVDKVKDIINDGKEMFENALEKGQDKSNHYVIFNEIEDENTRYGFSSSYKETIQKLYDDVPKEYSDARDLYDKHIKNLKVATFKSEDRDGNSSPYELGGVLYLNEEADLDNLRGDGTTFFHEYGHFIVNQEGWLNDNKATGTFKEFEDSLRKEVGQYIKRYEDQYREEGISKGFSGRMLDKYMEAKTSAALKKDILGSDNKYTHVNDGVSDIINGVSNSKYRPDYGHNDGYWEENQARVPNEAFANIFAAQMTGDEVELAKIREIMPETYEIYLKMVREAA